MATNEISGSDSVSDCSSVASIGSFIYALPDHIIVQHLLHYLGASDMCHVASCSRWLRDATNQDSRWRHLCRSRGWEQYGTTTDLAKIASYGPSEQVTGASEAGQNSATFHEDRIVTDDNTVGLTSTCRWKGVYMRAHHLNRNWAMNYSHFNKLELGSKPFGPDDSYVSADGDLLALCTSMYTVHVFDIRKEILQRFIRMGADLPIERIKIKDDVMVMGCRNGTVLVYDARTGQRLQVMDDCWSMEVQSLFFDGEVVIAETYVNPLLDNGYIYVWRVEDGKRHLLTMDDPEETNGWRDLDYRNKLLAAYHANNYICVWDVRSGNSLHKLNCPGTTANVKLGDNVIVGFSSDYIAMCVIISIWSLDTGECQHEIPLQCDNMWQPQDRHPYHLVNHLIILLIRHLDHAVVAYDLRGRLVTEETPIKFPTYRHPMIAKEKGSKCSFNVLFDKELQQHNEFIFEASPSGLAFLAAVNPDLCDAKILCMDEIRMIRYDAREGKLLIYHYW